METVGTLGTSPMMLAYAAAQVAAPDYLILYRLGEFYEVLGRNASTISRALGLQLTRRRQRDGDDRPMCGHFLRHVGTSHHPAVGQAAQSRTF